MALIRYKSVSRAAAELGISQPGLSKIIQALEVHFETELFHRLGRRLVINHQGTLLIGRAERHLESWRSLKASLLPDADGLHGLLVLGATSSIANNVLPNIIARFGQRNPKLTIRLIAGNYKTTLQNLLDHDIDLGLVASDCYAAGVESTFWRQDQLQIFCSIQHPLASYPPQSVSDFVHYEWYGREQGSSTRMLFEKALRDSGVVPKVRIELSSNEAVIKAVIAGRGLACLSSSALIDYLANKTIVCLPCPWLLLKRPWNIVHLHQRISSPAITQFRDQILSIHET